MVNKRTDNKYFIGHELVLVKLCAMFTALTVRPSWNQLNGIMAKEVAP